LPPTRLPRPSMMEFAMANQREQDSPHLLTVKELSVRTRLSLATIHRLKRQGKIPYYQPGGKGYSLRFPPDAVQIATRQFEQPPERSHDGHLSGPRPAWMQNQSPNS